MLAAHVVYGCGVEVYKEVGGKMYMEYGDIPPRAGCEVVPTAKLNTDLRRPASGVGGVKEGRGASLG